MDHEAVGSGAVPVLLVGLEQDAVAGADDLDGAAAALAQPDALGDEDGLAERVAVPVGAGAGHEVHQVGGEPGRRRGGGNCVDVDVAGEPVGRSLDGVDGAAGDLHGRSPPVWRVLTSTERLRPRAWEGGLVGGTNSTPHNGG